MRPTCRFHAFNKHYFETRHEKWTYSQEWRLRGTGEGVLERLYGRISHQLAPLHQLSYRRSANLHPAGPEDVGLHMVRGCHDLTLVVPRKTEAIQRTHISLFHASTLMVNLALEERRRNRSVPNFGASVGSRADGTDVDTPTSRAPVSTTSKSDFPHC